MTRIRRYLKVSIKRRAFIMAAILFMAVAAHGAEAHAEAQAKDDKDLYARMELFADVISTVRADYVDETDSKSLVYGALRGMLASLDDYSQFMDPKEYKEIKEEVKGEFGGIGVEVSLKDGILTVIAPISGSPADKAGIIAGDRVIRIDGKITKKMTLDDCVKFLRGDPGTTVKVTVWREREERILEFPLKRDIIKIESVKKASILADKVGYIRLIEFQENTSVDLESALAKLKKEGMDSLILDLRNNPGGLLDVSADIAEKFLPKDTLIVSTKSRIKDQNLEFRSKCKAPYLGFPLVVMVNEGSASASELVAGAIQDNKRGVVVGMKSYGKGSVQTVIPLKDGSALRLTTASYYTPSGRSIRGEGIMPDVVVEQGVCPKEPVAKKEDIFEKIEAKPAEKAPEAKKEEARDEQLERAVDIIKGIKAYQRVKV